MRQITRFVLPALLLVCLVSSGCVRRRLTVRSNPPGAVVYVDNQEIGRTPVSTPFTYYGTREIRLERAGYETVSIKRTFSPPWYQIPPIDFVSENLWPRELRDERLVEVELAPQQIVPDEVLRGRAEQLRAASQQGVVAPLPTPGAGPFSPPAAAPPGDALPRPAQY